MVIHENHSGKKWETNVTLATQTKWLPHNVGMTLRILENDSKGNQS